MFEKNKLQNINKEIDRDILVSVFIITYNHANYIATAIESVLMQKTNFSIEIIVGEDFSTDNTLQIVTEYAQKYPNIKIVTSNSNVGPQKNCIRTLKECRGKYVALLEGDDYWIDPLKLQKQVDILQKNPEYSVCFHNVKWYYETTGEFNGTDYNDKQSKEVELKDLAKGVYLKSCSLLFRNDNELLEPILSGQLYFEDTSLGYCLLQNENKAYYINEIMAVYRIHPGGVWSMINPIKRLDDDIKLTLIYIGYYNDKILKPQLKKQLAERLRVKFRYSLKRMHLISLLKTIALYFRFCV